MFEWYRFCSMSNVSHWPSPFRMNSSIHTFTFKLLVRKKLIKFHSPHAISCSMKTSKMKFSIKSGKAYGQRMWMLCPCFFSFSLWTKIKPSRKTIDIPCGCDMKSGLWIESTRCFTHSFSISFHFYFLHSVYKNSLILYFLRSRNSISLPQ